MPKPSTSYYSYATSHGPLTIEASSKGVTQVAFGQETLNGKCAPSELTNRAASQIQEYLAGKRRRFDVPLDPQGSAFQKAVWSAVDDIPYGQQCTPSDIASALGKPGSHRSVGTALRQNKLAPLIPTHRIIAPNATGQQARIFRAFQALEKRACEQGGADQ